MAKIAVVGNREGFTYEYVRMILSGQGIGHDDEIVSGGAAGVDSFAEQYAIEKGLNFRLFEPDPSVSSPKCYFDRNKKIVDYADRIIAFNNKDHSGTTNTINYARRVKKPVRIF
jgi:predicted Rossmann fold nucleotide-binding protein DprA/Smf involved in DNA uptake